MFSRFIKPSYISRRLSTTTQKGSTNNEHLMLEKLVLKEIRTSNVKELIIKMDKDGVIGSLYKITERIISGDEVKNVKKILGLGNYEEVILTTRNEKTIAFKKIKKNRLR